MCSILESTLVLAQSVSWRADFATVITWNRYPLRMLGLNVTSYLIPKAFLATHFANERCYLHWRSVCLFYAIGNHLLAFLHHWLDLLIQCRQSFFLTFLQEDCFCPHHCDLCWLSFWPLPITQISTPISHISWTACSPFQKGLPFKRERTVWAFLLPK